MEPAKEKTKNNNDYVDGQGPHTAHIEECLKTKHSPGMTLY